MNMRETNAQDYDGFKNSESAKIYELKSKLEKGDALSKESMTVQEADAMIEKRLSGSGTVESSLNKRQEVSFGASGCAGFCQKVHDGTRVHGTY